MARKKLKEDLALLKEVYAAEDSFIKDIEFESETLTFTFDAGNGKSKTFTIYCSDDYPDGTLLYLEDGDTKDYSKRLPQILEEIVKEQCKKLGVTPSQTTAAIPSTEADSKAKMSSKKRGKLVQSTDSVSEASEPEEEGSDGGGSDVEYADDIEGGEISTLLVKDMELVTKTFGKRALTTREYFGLDTLDVELHLDVSFLGLSVSDAWGVQRGVPISVRLAISPSLYLTAVHPPKVEVYQNSGSRFGLQSQLTQIMNTFCSEQWKIKDEGIREGVNLRSSGQAIPNNSNNNNNSGKGFMGNITSGISSLLAREKQTGGGKAGAAATDEKFDKDVASLMDMGFSIEKASNALKLTQTVEEALNLLLSDADSCTDEAVAEHLERERAAKSFKRNKTAQGSATGKNLNSNNPQAQWETFEKTAEDAKNKVPTRERGFLVQVLEYLRYRIPTLSNYCVICDRAHVFANGAMLKPAVCTRDLCCFAFQKLGVMSDAAEDIATEAEVVDLLVCMAKAAAQSTRCNDIFDPYPTVFDPDNPKKAILSPNSKDFNLVKDILSRLPSIREMIQAKDCVDMKTRLDRGHKHAYPLLQWIISSNRSHIVKLPKNKHLQSMNTPYQYVLLSAPPEKEDKFQNLKSQHGSVFAFHGSRVENWHSILRYGLKNASGTKLQLNGAAYGAGIYMSPHSATSFGYSRFCGGGSSSRKQDDRFLDSQNFFCIALCEVVNHSSIRKSGTVWVCPDEDFVVTRFFFVYDQSTSGSAPAVDTASSSFLSEITRALTRD
jgi:poly [ADP-ribose] polymerase 6/8